MTRSARPRRFNRPLLEPLEDRTLLSVYMVNRLTDTGDGSGLAGDLRYCITQATDGDSIQFGVQGVINLTSALPDLSHSISIEGPGQDALTVQPTNRGGYRTLTVDAGISDLITGLTLATALNFQFEEGGGILNAGTLTVQNVRFANNFAAGDNGGAIYNSGILTVSGCAFSGDEGLYGGDIYNDGLLSVNNSGFSGPRYHTSAGCGIYNALSGVVDLNTCVFSIISNDGLAAIYNAGRIMVSNTVFSRNEVSGAIYNVTSGILNISKSTFSGNGSNNYGGAIYNEGTLTVAESSFSQNGSVDTEGGAIYSDRGTLTVSDSTFLDNGSFERGGAIYASSLVLVNSTVTGSLIEEFGSAIDVGTGTISNCVISGNKCSALETGGQVTIENSTISGNKSTDPESAAGIHNLGTMTVSNCTISGNTGEVGGIWNSGTLTVTNSTISGNKATSSFPTGGGIANLAYSSIGDAIVTLVNCTLSGNTVPGPNRSAGQIYSGPFRVASTRNATVYVRNTLVLEQA